ncbi:hypothetical protein EOL70_13815 [Leucothrix sargassi]|nr:hypothetical protein EOL70_13815 [Leucothrix sargassi]
MRTCLALSIVTVPDVDAGRAIYKLDDLVDDGVYKAMVHLHNQQRGTDTLPLYQYRVVSASAVVLDYQGAVTISSFDDEDERDLLNKLAVLLANTNEVISWQGDQFDRPVLAYRFLKQRVVCPAVFDKYSTHTASHVSLNEELSGMGESNKRISLVEVAAVLGLPNAQGVERIDVLECYQQGDIAALTQACDIDALNTFIIGQRIELTKGELKNSEYNALCDTLSDYLSGSGKTHLKQYVAAWLPNNNK